ncbi:thioredoxin family protein [Ascidiaceihabitans sp.]|uniref:thioredoxin family protein n=1 Tax=Ascidiaceihabitans sp. TaxID=1872644 RepID=UPI003297CB40
MNRRDFFLACTATAVLPMAAQASTDLKDYTPGLIQDALDRGETVFVDYAADWCSTCARQERIIGQLRGENPAYNSAMMFVRVDWDDYKSHDVTTSRNIPRRSTLIVLKGGQELGRIVAGTSQADIKDLMDKGL